MLALKRILRNYDVFRDVLKFVLKNNENVEFKRFSLVNTFDQLLKELEERIDKIFLESIESKPLDFEILLKSIFKGELKEYRPCINSSGKKELIRRFEFLMDLANSSMDMEDMGGSVEITVIDEEIRRTKTFLQPLLGFISNQKSTK